MSYFELCNVLSQWKREFTSREFASTFASPDPNKVLHDMVKKGLLEKIGWGKYKVRARGRYVRMESDIPAAYERIKTAGLPYVLSGVDALFLWTKGGYNVDLQHN